MTGRLPDFIIAGARRCGTTSLARYLGSHPDVFMARQKEVHFFDRHFDRGSEWYAEQFNTPTDKQIRGEATPSYMANDLAIARMSDLLPNVHIIVSLRDPIDRLISHYWMRREQKSESRPIEKAIRQEIGIFRQVGLNSSEILYLRDSLYAHHLTRLRNAFPPANIMIVIFEQMKRNPSHTYQSICQFLNVEDSDIPAIVGKPINSYARFRSIRVRDWTKNTPYKRAARVIARLNTRLNVTYPSISLTLREELLEIFEPSNLALYNLLGESIPEWHVAHIE